MKKILFFRNKIPMLLFTLIAALAFLFLGWQLFELLKMNFLP